MQGISRKPTRSSIRIKKALFAVWLAALILFGGAGVACAQSGEEELYLDPITVTATRTPERLSDVADSVEVFGPERIDSLLPGDALDFLSEGAGVILPQASGRGGQASLFLRGSESNFTSVMIDGFKLTFPDGSAYDFGHLSPEWVGAAEILKGPQSPLYGSDAASGVVNFLPDFGKPGEAPSFTVRARGGSDDTFEEAFKLKGGTAKSGYVASLSRLDTEGHLPNDSYYRTVGTVGLEHFLSDKAKVRFLYHANRNRYNIPGPAYQGYTDPNNHSKFTEQLIGARAHLKPFSWLEYIPRLSLYLRDALHENRPDANSSSSSISEAEGTRLHFDNQINVRLSGKQLGFSALRRSISTLGVEWETEDISAESDFGFGKTEYESDRRATSIYAQQQFQFQESFTLAGGVRVDSFDAGEDETTGKLSASYKIPGTGARIRGAVGEGIKRPTFGDILSLYGQIGNPNLKSERQKSWEAGFDQYFSNKTIKFSATYYVNEIDDMIAWSPTPFANGTNYENVRKARVKGAELSFSLIDFHDFTTHASLSTMDAITLDDGGVRGAPNYVEGEPLLRRPDWWWSGSITYHPDRLKATFRVNTMGDRWDGDFSTYPAPRVINPGFTRVDLALALDVVKDGVSMFDRTRKSKVENLTVELKVNNALDEEYEAVYGFESPGRQWFAGVRAIF
ncbi:MAG: TonB-dependent receptor [Nitrospinae bacterium]|nr:TonB-dependent receptor [Nitrospinota bacterium]